MRQNATKCDIPKRVYLTKKQHKAIIALLEGKPTHLIARELRCHRSTLHRWQQMPAFQEALNQRVSEVQEAMQFKMHYVANNALTVIDHCVSERYYLDGRIKSAFHFLKILSQSTLIRHENTPKNDESDANLAQTDLKTVENTQKMQEDS